MDLRSVARDALPGRTCPIDGDALGSTDHEPRPQGQRASRSTLLRLSSLLVVLSVYLFLQCASPSASPLFPLVSAQCSGDQVSVDFPFVFGVTNGSCPTGAATVPVNSTCQMACGAGFTTGAGGLITCAGTRWTGQSLMCDPVECTVPPLPFGCTAGSCVPGGVLSGGASCTWNATAGVVLETGSLTITCGHFGITQGPTMEVPTCVPAALPPGTTNGRCDSSSCYLLPLPNWSLRFNTLRVQCSAGVPIPFLMPVMQPAEYTRMEPLFAPMLVGHQLQGSAVDTAEQYLYFTDASNSHVWRLTLATGALQQLDLGGTTLMSPTFALLDETLNALYVLDSALRNVFRLRLSDGVVSSALGVSGTLSTPEQMALDSARTNLYLVDGLTRQLYRLSLQSASPAQFVRVLPVSPFVSPYGLVLGPHDDAAYVSDSGQGQLFRINLTTNAISRITSGTLLAGLNPSGLAWDRTNTALLVGSMSQDIILSIPTSTGVPTTIALPSIAGRISGSIALSANGANAYAVTSYGDFLRVQVQPGCSGAALPLYFPMSNGVTLGSCPSDSTLRPWGYSCQLGCGAGYTPVSGGAVVCSQKALGWTGATQVCDPVSCALPPLPVGVSAGSCLLPSLLRGESCSYDLLPGFALSFGSLSVSCDHFGLTPGPVVDSTCNAATLPPGTTFGRCYNFICWLQALPGWTLKSNSLQVTCTGGLITGTLPIMEQAEYGRAEPLFSPLYQPMNFTGWTQPQSIVVDSASTYAYVIDSFNKHVWRLTLPSGAIRQMDTSGTVLHAPGGMCLDEIAGVMYISQSDTQQIIAGIRPMSYCLLLTSALGASPAACCCVFCLGDTIGLTVYRLTLSAGLVSPPLVKPNTLGQPHGLALDPTRTALFVADGGGIMRILLSDGSATLVASGLVSHARTRLCSDSSIFSSIAISRGSLFVSFLRAWHGASASIRPQACCISATRMRMPSTVWTPRSEMCCALRAWL